jgi:hypothetical protein
VFNVYARGSFFIKRVPIQVVVGQPIHIDDYADEQSFKATISDWYDKQAKNIIK